MLWRRSGSISTLLWNVWTFSSWGCCEAPWPIGQSRGNYPVVPDPEGPKRPQVVWQIFGGNLINCKFARWYAPWKHNNIWSVRALRSFLHFLVILRPCLAEGPWVSLLLIPLIFYYVDMIHIFMLTNLCFIKLSHTNLHTANQGQGGSLV